MIFDLQAPAIAAIGAGEYFQQLDGAAISSRSVCPGLGRAKFAVTHLVDSCPQHVEIRGLEFCGRRIAQVAEIGLRESSGAGTSPQSQPRSGRLLHRGAFPGYCANMSEITLPMAGPGFAIISSERPPSAMPSQTRIFRCASTTSTLPVPIRYVMVSCPSAMTTGR